MSKKWFALALLLSAFTTSAAWPADLRVDDAWVRNACLWGGHTNKTCERAFASLDEEARAYAWQFRGVKLAEDDRLWDAVDAQTRSIKLKPAFSNAYNSRAWYYCRLDLPDKGLADALRAVELEPNNHEYIDTLGHVYRKLGQLDLAERNFAKALEIQPGHPSSVEGLELITKARQ
ncbi:MAG TPA: tetratricopeptide repeat protein [Candidatus Paceibacterota bacterium]|jgi:tetratricopeptide (TPR) repeat protein|nr:tetratricopeptide repeat protein [Candidatus Paceibacterota bacterium]